MGPNPSSQAPRSHPWGPNGKVRFELITPNPKLKLLEQVREVMRLRDPKNFPRSKEWEVMVDLFFYRDPEEERAAEEVEGGFEGAEPFPQGTMLFARAQPHFSLAPRCA